jgi:hypothetical protein
MRFTTKHLLAVFVWLAFSGGIAQAASHEVFGDYTVYYNAFNSDTLQPEMAEAYNIVRSKNRGMVTLSVIKKSMSPVGTPVRAKVTLSASNLTGQLRQMETREVVEGNSVYYLSEFVVAHEEVLAFTVEVTPEGESRKFTVKFRQKFYTD